MCLGAVGWFSLCHREGIFRLMNQEHKLGIDIDFLTRHWLFVNEVSTPFKHSLT